MAGLGAPVLTLKLTWLEKKSWHADAQRRWEESLSSQIQCTRKLLDPIQPLLCFSSALESEADAIRRS